jgi:Ca2+-binding EF-hand superfamily protein
MDFLRRHKNVNEIDVDAIFRRVDNDADDILNYQEFVECLMPSQVSTFRSLKVSSTHAGFKGLASQGGNNQSLKNIPQSPSKWSSSISTQKPVSKTLPPGYQSSTFSSSMRKVSSPSPRRASPTKSLRNNTSLKPSSPIRSSNLNISSRSLHKKPLKSQDQCSGRSPLRSSQSRAYTSQDLSQKPESSIISIEEKELVGWFQEEIKINRDVERKKNELSLKHDFNLFDAFRMFDRQGTGYANLNDFQETFEYFNFSAPKDEIFLLIKHFSNSGQLNFKQFSEVISPKQEEYARILRNRSSNDLDLEFPEFSRETLNTFLETFRLLLDAESLAERVRQRLTRMPDFSLYQAFMAVDKGRDGFITIDEFQSVLQSHSIFASTKDLQSLLGKYDKNKDGRVSYTDFIEEITPKSPKRF